MNVILAATAAITLLAATATSSAQDIWSVAPKSASMKQWQAWYKQRERFFDSKNLDALSQQIDKNCKQFGTNGKLLPGNGVETLRGLFGQMATVKANVHVISVKKAGSDYEVTVRYSFDLTTPLDADHKSHAINSSGTSVNIWKPTAGKMLLVEVKALTIKNKVDGKPA